MIYVTRFRIVRNLKLFAVFLPLNKVDTTKHIVICVIIESGRLSPGFIDAHSILNCLAACYPPKPSACGRHCRSTPNQVHHHLYKRKHQQPQLTATPKSIALRWELCSLFRFWLFPASAPFVLPCLAKSRSPLTRICSSAPSRRHVAVPLRVQPSVACVESARAGM